MPTRVAVIGATGRLGSQVAQVVSAMPDMTLVASLDSRSDLQEMLGADIAVDVTLPSVSKTVVEFALSQGIKVLVGYQWLVSGSPQRTRESAGEEPRISSVCRS